MSEPIDPKKILEYVHGEIREVEKTFAEAVAFQKQVIDLDSPEAEAEGRKLMRRHFVALVRTSTLLDILRTHYAKSASTLVSHELVATPDQVTEEAAAALLAELQEAARSGTLRAV